jgi:hypothetical protein
VPLAKKAKDQHCSVQKYSVLYCKKHVQASLWLKPKMETPQSSPSKGETNRATNASKGDTNKTSHTQLGKFISNSDTGKESSNNKRKLSGTKDRQSINASRKEINAVGWLKLQNTYPW